MARSDTPILVTGATGYVAGWILRRLLEAGHLVHGAVRDPSARFKLEPLERIAAASGGALRWFHSDLMDPGSYAEAMRGCRVVIHTASPVIARVDDPQTQLVDPAVHGTRNVLRQASESGTVRRVVVTSSLAAVGCDNIELKERSQAAFDESDWNTGASLTHLPYFFAKTLAEREAWAIAEAQNRWDLITINPSLVLGPAIRGDARPESVLMAIALGGGKMRIGVPHYELGVVDVRDVAQAHLAAAFQDSVSGRYVVSGHNTSLWKLAEILRQKYGARFPLPKRVLPKSLVWLFGPWADKSATRRFVSRNIGHPYRADHSKSVRELGLEYRPLEETLFEMFEQLIETGAISG